MAVVALASVRSCAVTTTTVALAAAWPGSARRLIVELDPAGGTLAAQFDLKSEPSLVSLAAAARRRDDAELVWEHCQELSPGTQAVTAPPSREQAVAACGLLSALPGQLSSVDADVFVDCGRLSERSIASEMFDRADVSVLVTRPQLADLHALAAWLERHTGVSEELVLLLVGIGPYRDAEVEEALGIEVLGSIPHDSEAAACLQGSAPPRVLERSPLLRHTRAVAGVLHGRCTRSAAATRPLEIDDAIRTPFNPIDSKGERETARS